MGCGCKNKTRAQLHSNTLKPVAQRPAIALATTLTPLRIAGQPIQPFNPGNMDDSQRRIQRLQREAVRRSLNR